MEDEDVVFFVVLFELVGDGIVEHDQSMEGSQNQDSGSVEMNGANDNGGDEDVDMGVD